MSAPSDAPAATTYEVLTPPGPAALAIIGVSGPGAGDFAARHLRTARPLHLGAPGDVRRATLVDGAGEALDEILVSIHAPPPSWVLRLHLHGNPWLVNQCIALLDAGGAVATAAPAALFECGDEWDRLVARLLPRVLTLGGARWLARQPALLRAAIRDLATSPPERRRALMAEMVRRGALFEWFSRPLRVALLGPPNAGKSTLINALTAQELSLVSPTPGTTRDWVEAAVEVGGFPLVWIDTAGVRAATDELEAASIDRARQVSAAADATVVVLDGSIGGTRSRAAFIADHPALDPVVVALTKADLPVDPAARAALPATWRERTIEVAAATSEGLRRLEETLLIRTGRAAADVDGPAAFCEEVLGRLKHVTRVDLK